MVLQEGKLYILRNGQTVGPMFLYQDGHRFGSDGGTVDLFIGVWKEDGQSDFFYSDQEPDYDIVSEVE
jgi:hypothetical protein